MYTATSISSARVNEHFDSVWNCEKKSVAGFRLSDKEKQSHATLSPCRVQGHHPRVHAPSTQTKRKETNKASSVDPDIRSKKNLQPNIKNPSPSHPIMPVSYTTERRKKKRNSPNIFKLIPIISEEKKIYAPTQLCVTQFFFLRASRKFFSLLLCILYAHFLADFFFFVFFIRAISHNTLFEWNSGMVQKAVFLVRI